MTKLVKIFISMALISTNLGITAEYPPAEQVSFVTRSGEEFRSVTVTEVTLFRIRIQTEAGVVSIPFTDLPEDLSVFPADIRTKIESRLQSRRPRSAGNSPGSPSAENVASPVTPPVQPVEIALFPTWESQGQGAARVRDELRQLLTPEVEPKRNVSISSFPLIYKDVRLMMPVKEALAALKYTDIPPRRVLCATSGFPKSSFYYYKIRYTDESPYNLLYLITDGKDQVLSVQLVCENPSKDKRMSVHYFGKGDKFGNFDFVELSSKAFTRFQVFARLDTQKSRANAFSGDLSSNSSGSSSSYSTSSKPSEILTAFLVLYDPGDWERKIEPETKRITKWYLPVQVAELIQHCLTLDK